MLLSETVRTRQVRAQADGELLEVNPGIMATTGQQWVLTTRGMGASLPRPGPPRRPDRLPPGGDR